MEGKVPVLGMVERGGKVITKVVANVTKEELREFISGHVEHGSYLFTDELAGYQSLGEIFIHQSAIHSAGVYVDGKAHTNTIEGFWSLLKRQIIGIHHSVSEKHLQRYSNEVAYRYNERNESQCKRFQDAIRRCEKRLKYEQLVK